MFSSLLMLCEWYDMYTVIKIHARLSGAKLPAGDFDAWCAGVVKLCLLSSKPQM